MLCLNVSVTETWLTKPFLPVPPVLHYSADTLKKNLHLLVSAVAVGIN